MQRERGLPELPAAPCRPAAARFAASRPAELVAGLHRELAKRPVLRQLLRTALEQVFR